jgi:DNA-binding transcriptional LysR family regulator
LRRWDRTDRTLEIGSTEAIKQLVAAGLGVSIVSRASVKEQLSLKHLKIVAVRDLHIERTLWKIKAAGRIDIPAAAAFERLIAPKI